MKKKKLLFLLFLILIAGSLETVFTQEKVSVKTAVEKTEVYVGESFQFQIQIDGTDEVPEPELPDIEGFQIKFLGGRSNSSTSISIINGKMTQTIIKAYILPYQFIPQRPGVLSIPAVTVTAAGTKFTTEPVIIRAKEPQETEEFKLRLSLSSETCYTGEPVTLTVTWYLGLNVSSYQFTFPLMKGEKFDLFDPEIVQNPSLEYIRLLVDSEELVAEKGSGTLEGRRYTTITFRKILVPGDAGSYTIPKAVISLETPQSSGNSFGSLFNFGRNTRYLKFVVPSNSPTLTVLRLPAAGKPAGFNGPVGEYRIETGVSADSANVGDPITLTITLSGSPFMKNVTLPPLQEQQHLAENFKIPSEMSPGKVEGKRKVFVQTIRPMHEDIEEIPPIEFSYFNPETETYEVARSNPLPLTIHPTREVTYQDVEGEGISIVTKKEVEALMGGLAANYEDLSVLDNQLYGLETLVSHPLWMTVTGTPFIIFVLLFSAARINHRSKSNPKEKEAKKALRELTKALKHLRVQSPDPGTGRPQTDTVEAGDGYTDGADALPSLRLVSELLNITRNYLGSRLQIRGTAITFKDIEPLLEKNVSRETLDDLEDIFAKCEAGRYAGGSFSEKELSLLPEKIRRVAVEIDRGLKE